MSDILSYAACFALALTVTALGLAVVHTLRKGERRSAEAVQPQRQASVGLQTHPLCRVAPMLLPYMSCSVQEPAAPAQRPARPVNRVQAGVRRRQRAAAAAAAAAAQEQQQQHQQEDGSVSGSESEVLVSSNY